MNKVNKIVENRNTLMQKIWTIFVRLAGVVMFVSPLYLPIVAYFSEDKQNVVMTYTDIGLIVTGFFLSSGGKKIGILSNNIGTIIVNFLNKLSR